MNADECARATDIIVRQARRKDIDAIESPLRFARHIVSEGAIRQGLRPVVDPEAHIEFEGHILIVACMRRVGFVALPPEFVSEKRHQGPYRWRDDAAMGVDRIERSILAGMIV